MPEFSLTYNWDGKYKLNFVTEKSTLILVDLKRTSKLSYGITLKPDIKEKDFDGFIKYKQLWQVCA